MGYRFIPRYVREAESGIPDVRLELEPYVKTDSGTVLHFRLHYEGYKLLTLQSISAAMPDALRDPAWHAISVAGHLEVERKMIDDVFYYCEIYLAANSVPDRLSGGYDFKVLGQSYCRRRSRSIFLSYGLR